MRRYDDPVEVRQGQVSGMEGPEQFLWRGRLWKVRAVLAHWVETGPWWQSAGVRAVVGSDEGEGSARSTTTAGAGLPGGGLPGAGLPGAGLPGADLLGERELWRVEAGRGAAVAAGGEDGGGVFDLSFDWSDGRWQLVGCED